VGVSRRSNCLDVPYAPCRILVELCKTYEEFSLSTSATQLCALKKEWRLGGGGTQTAGVAGGTGQPLDSEDLKKIKKVQSFFRGWLCRRRWKQIVEEYIRSPHAEAMRKRNRFDIRIHIKNIHIICNL